MTGTATDSDPAWADAVRAVAAFAVDPAGTGGLAVRAGPGPVRDRLLALLRALLPDGTSIRRLPLDIADGRLLGGLDLAATLQAGRPVAERGLLAEAHDGVILASMAERLASTTVAHLAACLDTGALALERDGFGLRVPARFGVVALDEGVTEDERVSPVLQDRLAFLVDLGSVERMFDADPPDRARIEAARARLPGTEVPEAVLEALCGTALALGIGSIRPSLQALAVARALAALAGRATVLREDAAEAARLVLAPRATRLQAPPDAPEETRQDPAPPPDPADAPEAADRQAGDGMLDDVVLAAARAAIPPGLLARLRLEQATRRRPGGAGRAGAPQPSVRRGRPAGIRRGEPRRGLRLNVIETLRAAAPWQRLRRETAAPGQGTPGRVLIRRDDFRVTRLKHRTETTTIFVVDASGSSALNRLAEAKGAIELLLAECYVRRDQVALVAFRGTTATLLLPATRSLVRAKRCLAGLPGGGGTPLASGIDAAAALAESVRRQGRMPVVIVMTDGRANIDRAGQPGRARAEADAIAAARRLRLAGLTTLLIDTAPKPQKPAAVLASEMGGLYLPLPQADAALLSQSVQAATRAAPAGAR